MAVTRLERKGRKNKAVAKKRVNTMKQLNSLPSIKNIDIEAIKAEFAKKKEKPVKKEKPKAERKVEETTGQVEAEVKEEKPKKKAPAKKSAAKKKAVPKKGEKED